MVWAPYGEFGSSSKIRSLADLRLNEIKGSLGGGLRCLSAFTLVVHCLLQIDVCYVPLFFFTFRSCLLLQDFRNK